MKNEPVFLTDKERTTIIEVICGSANASLPDCFQPFEVLTPNTSDGASEKHLPVIETSGNHVTVTVGSNVHPMTEDHSISWICLYTKAGCVQRICLSPDCEPVARFCIEEGDAPQAAYAYCNLHGFWKTEA